MSLGSRSVYCERSVVWFARLPKPRVEFRYLATEDPMATQIVMDRTGDTRHNFDAKNADALLKAEERFRELTGAGFTAAVRTSSQATSCWHRKLRWRPMSVARWPWRTDFSCQEAHEIHFSNTELVFDFIAPDGRAGKSTGEGRI